MRRIGMFSVAAVSVLGLSFDARAQRLTLPYSQSCNDAAPCFAINNLGSGTSILGWSSVGGAGVRGETTTGYGVHGYANGTGGRGVVGSSALGIGVGGETNSGQGVLGIANDSGTAVYGESRSGLSGHFKTTSTAGGSAALKVEAPLGGTGIYGYNPGGTVAWFEGNIYAGTYGSTSDGRLKKDVGDLSYGLGQLLELRPVAFRWKRDDGKTHLGLIAQDVEKIIPDVVSHTPDPLGSDVMTVSYSELVPILIKAIQQQNRFIVEQENRITALERERSPIKLSSILGAAVLGLVPLGLVLASRRRKGQESHEPE